MTALRNWDFPKSISRSLLNSQRSKNNLIAGQLDVLRLLHVGGNLKRINWFDRSVWLANLSLRISELVVVAGRVYRYEIEKGQHVLTPVD